MLTGKIVKPEEAGRLSFRSPDVGDVSAIHALVKCCAPLDVNSRFCYLSFCEHFASTCVVAEQGDNVDAFISDCISSKLPIDSVRKTLIGRRER